MIQIQDQRSEGRKLSDPTDLLIYTITLTNDKNKLNKFNRIQHLLQWIENDEKHNIFIKIHNYQQINENEFRITCKKPYDYTPETYYQEKQRVYEEIQSHLFDMIQIHKFCYQIHKLFFEELKFDLKDQSIVFQRNDLLPFPSLCLTPMVFLSYLINNSLNFIIDILSPLYIL